MTTTAPESTLTQPYSVVADVSPEMAEELLKFNTKNRKIVPQAVKEYAKAMHDGRWLFDAAPIRISTDGVVLDGQHRLHAIVQSGTTQRMSIWKNLAPETQAVMDTGRKRSFANALTLSGEVNPNNLAAATSAFYYWEHGVRDASLAAFGTINGVRPQITELQEFFNQYRDELVEAVIYSSRVYRVLPLSQRVTGMLWMIVSQKDREDAMVFFEKLISGTDMGATDPILQVRNRILVEHGRIGKLDAAWQVGILLKAWNLFRTGATVARLQYKLTNDDKFPEPK
jgi:hypothetical protein